MGKPSINGPCSMAMLDNQRVIETVLLCITMYVHVPAQPAPVTREGYCVAVVIHQFMTLCSKPKI